MEERRFDDLTRVLGGARTRRQLFKGLLGGLVAAVVGRVVAPSVAEAAACNRNQCKTEAHQVWLSCNTACSNLNRGQRNEQIGCQLACMFALIAEQRECGHSASGCFAGNACCDQQCVSLQGDTSNCGACGHVCQPGEDCVDGHCKCGQQGTMCDGQCVDTQIDSHHCGNCETVCDTCKTCVNGSCVDVDCGLGKVCCHDQCFETCGQGQQFDPTTCECNSCQSEIDGTPCGTNEVCCGSQCISTQCGSGKQFALGSCGCICTPVSCPTGKTQDPNTCACVDNCSGPPCDTCHQCNPDTGQCVPMANGTICADPYGCCNGQCSLAPGSPCCPTSQQDVCGDTCCSEGTACTGKVNSNAQICCPIDADHAFPPDALPDGTCCAPGSGPYHMIGCPLNASDTWICCPDTAGGVYGCCAYG